jgi:hypothetical protein
LTVSIRFVFAGVLLVCTLASVSGSGASRALLFDGPEAAPAATTKKAPAVVSVSDQTLDFGSVPLGQGAGRTLVFRNAGDVSAHVPVVEGVTTKGSATDAFFVDTSATGYGPDGCPNLETLDPGQYCLFNLSFAPVDETRGGYRGDACFAVPSDESAQRICVKLTGHLDRGA